MSAVNTCRLRENFLLVSINDKIENWLNVLLATKGNIGLKWGLQVCLLVIK